VSLKVFHIVFIIVSVALCAFVAIWSVRDFLATRDNNSLVLGVVFLCSGAVLIAYGVRTFRKLKEL
jgi:hypothetical protein